MILSEIIEPRRTWWRVRAARLGALMLIVGSSLWLSSPPAYAHHVLGRPSYSLNEDSNTPPGTQLESQVGEYLVTFMVFPAFPRPNEPGRVNVYISGIHDGEPFLGNVGFKVKKDSWLGGGYEPLGVQPPDDNVFRQSFLFHEAGDYVVRAEFDANGRTHQVEFPLRIGTPWPVGPIGAGVVFLVVALVAANVVRRKRLLTAKLRSARTEDSTHAREIRD